MWAPPRVSLRSSWPRAAAGGRGRSAPRRAPDAVTCDVHARRTAAGPEFMRLLLALPLLAALADGAPPPGCPCTASCPCGTVCPASFEPGGCHAPASVLLAPVQLLSNAAGPAECAGACEAQNVSGCCATVPAASGALTCEWTAGGAPGGYPTGGQQQRSALCDGFQLPPEWPPLTNGGATPAASAVPVGEGTVAVDDDALQALLPPWPPATGTHCTGQTQGGCEGPPGSSEHSLTLLANATESECLGACASMNSEGCCWRPAKPRTACWWVGPGGVRINRGTAYKYTSSACSFPSPLASKADTPPRFVPDTTNTGTMDTDWVNWVVISAMPQDMASDAARAQFLTDWDPDLIDWYLASHSGE